MLGGWIPSRPSRTIPVRDWRAEVKGQGLQSFIRSIIGTKYAYGKTTSKTLKKFANSRVVELNVYRIPLSSAVTLALNGATFGLWNKLSGEYGIDKFFHLSLVATLQTSSGLRNVIIEKNEIVNISTDYKTSSVTEVYPVPLRGCKITLGSLIDDTLRAVGLPRFFEYDAFTNNCQWFIRYILQNNCNDLYNAGIANFLFQDITEMVKRLPAYTPRLARAVTDLGALTARLTGKGRGRPSRPSREDRDRRLYRKFKVAMKQI